VTKDAVGRNKKMRMTELEVLQISNFAAGRPQPDKGGTATSAIVSGKRTTNANMSYTDVKVEFSSNKQPATYYNAEAFKEILRKGEEKPPMKKEAEEDANATNEGYLANQYEASNYTPPPKLTMKVTLHDSSTVAVDKGGRRAVETAGGWYRGTVQINKAKKSSTRSSSTVSVPISSLGFPTIEAVESFIPARNEPGRYDAAMRLLVMERNREEIVCTV